MRLFIATYPSEEARSHLAAFLPTLAIGRPAEPGRSLRLVRREQWHLTLAFLGEVPEKRGEAAGRAVAGGLSEWATLGAPPVIRLGGSGELGRAKLTPVCVGVLGDVEALKGLTKSIRSRLRAVGLPYDTRPPRPHLTLARPGDRLPAEAIAADRSALAEYEGPAWTVDEVRLMSSELGPYPKYTVVGSWRLASGGA